MNPTLFRTLFFTFSFKQQLKLVFFTFLSVLMLPFLAIVVVTRIGSDTVSDQLVTANLQDHTIEIRNPATGEIDQTLTITSVWPATGVVTLEFGESDLPYQVMHTGIDIANPQGKIGDPVKAFMTGRVIYAGEISWGYGKHVIIDHGNNITSIYAHLNSISVTENQEIETGQIIGMEGSTGWSTGPHLHFEVRAYGIPVNPRDFLSY